MMRGLLPAGVTTAILFLLMQGTAAAQEAPPLEVFYPPPAAIVEKQYLTVEGMVKTPDIDKIEILVNGEDRYQAGVRRFHFAEEVLLQEGMNSIRVGNEQRQVFLLAGKDAPPADFQRVYGHHGLDEGCAECHRIDDAGNLTLAGTPEEICGWCHGDLVRSRGGATLASVHEPVREGKCLTCHAAHLSRQPGLPSAKPPSCQACHAAVYERLQTDRFVHGPMNLGDCRLCHAIHSSAEPILLVRPATALCTDCHSDALTPPGTPEALRPHRMIPEGQCFKCHFAHSSPNTRMLRQPAGRLCLECHAEKTKSFHEAKGFSIYICSKCHDLHRPTQPHLIIDASRSLCLDCHDFRGEKMAFTHSFAREGRCFLCHTFHEASLPGDVATTCLRCHRDTPNLPAVHGGVPFERSRCTSCHLPHQSRRPKLLRAEEHTPFAKRECGRCHTERADKIGALYRPLCLVCHANKDLGTLPQPPAQVHPPFKEQDCSGCHSSHGSESAGILAVPEIRLCLDCHRKLKKSTILTPRSTHRDFIEGRCHLCHDPHFSGNEALLKKTPSELCAGCHAALLQSPEGKPWPVRHAPVEELKCRICHRHHSSTNPALLKSPAPQPCRPCHQPFFSDLESRGNRSRHAPVAEGKCGVCHQLHGGVEARLLRAGVQRDLCKECHREVTGAHHQITAAELKSKEGGEKANEHGCLHCHTPHAGVERKLLPSVGSPVCHGCHKT